MDRWLDRWTDRLIPIYPRKQTDYLSFDKMKKTQDLHMENPVYVLIPPIFLLRTQLEMSPPYQDGPFLSQLSSEDFLSHQHLQ